MDANSNPLFEHHLSDVDSESSASSVVDAAPSVTTSTVAVLQTFNIKSHVPVELDLAESNYTEWRCFFDAFIGKFGLSSHLSEPPTAENRRDPSWVMRDQCLLS
jgi:hypothetical protein